MTVTFERTLEPTMDGHIAKIDGDFWTFEGKRKAKLMFLGFYTSFMIYF